MLIRGILQPTAVIIAGRIVINGESSGMSVIAIARKEFLNQVNLFGVIGMRRRAIQLLLPIIKFLL